jgi:SAM-dependent methyltransferase
MEINESAKKMANNIGISFEKDILNQANFFDVVIFRGTIQHLPNPFSYIQNAYNSLKIGGYIIFLATPNSNSLFYKYFNDLPALQSEYNFYIPSDITLSNILVNNKFKVLEVEKPYINSPYSQPILDHLKFFKRLVFRGKDDFAFWGNMMNVIAKKIEN